MRPLRIALIALGCGSSDGPSGLAANCGDLPDGQVWIAQAGCTATCVRAGRGVTTCRPDGGAVYCPADDDIHNCGACGNDCIIGACRPIGGATYSAACTLSACVCTRTN